MILINYGYSVGLSPIPPLCGLLTSTAIIQLFHGKLVDESIDILQLIIQAIMER